jgi:hypothetical protein
VSIRILLCNYVKEKCNILPDKTLKQLATIVVFYEGLGLGASVGLNIWFYFVAGYSVLAIPLLMSPIDDF